MDLLLEMAENLEAGNAAELYELVEQGLENGLSAEKILNEGLIRGMNVVGRKFKEGEIFIPEVLIAARAMTRCIGRLEPLLVQSGVRSKGKLLIGTVKDDLHDIGKNLVAIMFKGAGFEVIDLGVNISAEKFAEEAQKHQPDVIGLSALLTTTMVNMDGIVKQLRSGGCKAVIMIGGAPVSEEYARSIQADLYARNAVEGVEKALQALQ